MRRLGLISWAKMPGGPVQPGPSKETLSLYIPLSSFGCPDFGQPPSLSILLLSSSLLSFNSFCSQGTLLFFTGAASHPQLTAHLVTVMRRREREPKEKERKSLVLVRSSFLRDIFDRCFFNIFGRPFSSFIENRSTGFLEDRRIFAAILLASASFSSCQTKMKAVLVQNKIAPAICSPNKYPESWKGKILAEKFGDAHSCLTLHLTDNVLREIDEKDNAFEIWTKLEKLYLRKSLSTKFI
ncbi:hypothetical protein M9H77_13538 [Catharanthus roseus]|uniref:Uncharacterized protein n=1 Tax=Catharanthus roseus TaxID=4058 RepID=A0ACC0BKF3_CATRO|nr:hypothetical protein M9H77_13538 [Catharanthus roseus]